MPDRHTPLAADAAANKPTSMEKLSVLHERLVRLMIVVSVIGGLTFNFVLCFVNTRITPTWESYVMASEMLLIACALFAALDKRAGMYMFMAIFFTYMVLLFTLRGATDIKAIRDVIVPVVFYFVGARARDLKLADQLVTASVAIVLGIGLFEYFAVETFLDNFNVLGYYLSRGSINLGDTFGHTRGLFISGLRPEPRTILPFLGQHRVASIFLEPVSAGNFGFIAYSWTLFRGNMRWRFPIMACALACVILADARFGLYTCILVTAAYPFLRFTPKLMWLVMPFIMLALFTAYGIATGTQGGDNSLGGRLEVTAHLITSLPLDVVLGVAVTDQFTADSGLAYTLTKFGIFGFIGLWAALVYVPMKDNRAWTYLTMILIYLLLLMLISNSFYSIKTGALLWFALGTLTNIDLPNTPSRLLAFLLPARVFGRKESAAVSAPAPDMPVPSLNDR